MPVNDFLEQREEEYGPAWKTTGEIIQVIGLEWMSRLDNSGFFFPWVMILNKLVRALASPNKLDHWVDIIGYATLVKRELEKRQGVAHDA